MNISKILIALSLLLAVALPANAQMTDAAVKDYIKTGLASGKSQQEIARELAVRGVTREQAERITQQYDKEGPRTDEAFRTAGQQERERRMESVLTQENPTDLDVLATMEQENWLTDADAEDKTPIFGRNIFTNKNLTFAPNAQLPTPPNYRLGPGDEVIIDIWGANQASIRQTISPDGTINIPDIGLVNLNGMTVKEADAYLRRMLGRI